MNELLDVELSPILIADGYTEPMEVEEIPPVISRHAGDAAFLRQYCFPVEERSVFYKQAAGVNSAENYKAIVRSDSNKVISIMKKTYRVVSNEDVLSNMLKQLSRLDSEWCIEPSHSFVTNERMKLQIKFPDIRLVDDESEIPLSVFIHNSYDGSEGVRILWGAIRGICTNGMIFGKALGRYYHRHTRNISIGDISKQLNNTIEKLPMIQNRINELQQTLLSGDVDNNELAAIKKHLGAAVYDYVGQHINGTNSLWDIYNYATYHISHTIDQRMRTHYQLQLSKVFEL